jgi:hypothetical protein
MSFPIGPKGTYFNVDIQNPIQDQISVDGATGTYKILLRKELYPNVPGGPLAARQQANMDLLGYTQLAFNADGTKFFWSRIVPYGHPAYVKDVGPKGRAFSFYEYATHVNWEVKGSPWADQMNPATTPPTQVAFTDMGGTVGWATRPYPVVDDNTCINTLQPEGATTSHPNPTGMIVDESFLYRYCEIQWEPRGYNQTMPQFAGLYFLLPATGGKTAPAVSTTFFFPISFSHITIKQYQLPVQYVPYTDILRSQGKTNDKTIGASNGPWGFFGGQFPPGTLIYNSPSISKPYRMTDSNWAVDITHHMDFRPNYGYQFVINPLTGSPMILPNPADPSGSNQWLLGVNAWYQFNPQTGLPPGFCWTARDGVSYIDTTTGRVLSIRGGPGDPNALSFKPYPIDRCFNPSAGENF